jgi:fluoride ion exporter CrcB/FEX
MRVRDRSTVDLIVVFLTGMVGFYIACSLLFVAISELIHPDNDTSLLLNRVGAVVYSIVGAVIGFIGGRATGHLEGEHEERRRAAQRSDSDD